MAVDRNALRRLQRILDDEDYGPKLARLSAADERHVLGLVAEGRGREARAQILVLDERRRENIRARAAASLEERAFQNAMQRHREGGVTPYGPGILAGVRLMTRTEQRFTATATRQQLVDKARQMPDRVSYKDEDWNPWWYH